MSVEILKGAEPFFFKGNDIGVLALHGFTGSTQSMRFLGETLAKEGYTVLGPRLTGHGISPEAMAKSSYQDWFQDVENALAELKKHCSKIFVTGLSMGGALTCYLAENHPDVLGIMPVNAAVDMPAFKEIYDAESQKGTEFLEGIGSDIKAEGITELAYPRTPVKSIKDILDLMIIVRRDLPKIQCPTLIFSSTVDHVVPPNNSPEILEKIQSKDKKLILLENSYHVATLDNDRFLIAEECIKFINSHV